MEPLAAALGRQIHSAPPPYRSEYDGDSGSAADLVGHLGAGAVSTALCLPDAVVKITVAALLGTLGPDSPTRTPVPVHRHPMDGDCLWALAFHAAQLVAADHYPDLTVPKP